LEENVEKPCSIFDKIAKNFIKKLSIANKKLLKRKVYDMTNKSVFSYQNFQINQRKFPQIVPLRRYLTMLNLI